MITWGVCMPGGGVRTSSMKIRRRGSRRFGDRVYWENFSGHALFLLGHALFPKGNALFNMETPCLNVFIQIE